MVEATRRVFEGKLTRYASTEDIAMMVQLYGVCWLCASKENIVAFDMTRPIGGKDNHSYQNVCASCIAAVKTLHGLQGNYED